MIGERPVQLSGRLCEQIAMHDIVFWNLADRGSEFPHDVSEQTEVDVHVNRFADVIGARPFENQRDASRIEMRLES